MKVKDEQGESALFYAVRLATAGRSSSPFKLGESARDAKKKGEKKGGAAAANSTDKEPRPYVYLSERAALPPTFALLLTLLLAPNDDGRNRSQKNLFSMLASLISAFRSSADEDAGSCGAASASAACASPLAKLDRVPIAVLLSAYLLQHGASTHERNRKGVCLRQHFSHSIH